MMRVTALLLCSWSCAALTLQTEANPIRKVVTLLQDMQKEIEAEGEKEKGLYDKFMCYCDGNTDGMSKSAEEAAQRITELKSKLEAEKSEKAQLDQELMQHKQDRESAKADLAQATEIREKEHKEYVEFSTDQKSNLDAMTGAIAALEKGMGKAFLQGGSAGRLIKVVQASSSVDDYERSSVMAFLSGKQNPFGDYSSQSGEIVGILKAMKDEMDKDLGGAVSAEEEAAKGFGELAAAKKAQIAAAGEAIEAKTKRSGGLAVSVVTTADDIEDTTAELSDTQAFLANLASQCATKKNEWDERSKIRTEEVAAISEAIKILNDDDALDLFKKTLSLSQETHKFGFLQKKSSVSVAARARDVLSSLMQKNSPHKQQLELIEFGLKAKKVDFTKVISMIDGMVLVLKEEQKNDDAQKAFCDKDMAAKEDEKKDTESAISTSEAFIEETTAASEETAEEIAALQKDIKALDKAVAEATEQRKEEHSDFLQFQTENNAALQLIEKAKNRLYKFYRPNLYKEAPKQELTDEEKILAASGRSDMIATEAPVMIAGTTQTVFVQFRAHVRKAAPPPPPDTWGAYQKKDGKSNGVIGLMDMLMKELQGDVTEATHDEETSQKDYERLMSDSQASRAQNVESITDKEGAKADMDVKVEQTKQQKASQETELGNVKQYIVQLHASCDFLVENFDLRKAARTNELESLANAKSVLSGADFA
jgi:chromosome segregation ATPase